MRNINILFLIILAWAGAVTSASAQPVDDNFTDQIIIVVDDYKPILAEPVKQNFDPSLPPIENAPIAVTYDLPSKYLKLPYKAPDVKPLAMKPEPLDTLDNVFARIGLGNRAMPFLDINLTT